VRIFLSVLGLFVASTCQAQASPAGPYGVLDVLPVTRVAVPGGEIAVGIAAGRLGLPRERVLPWIEESARALGVRENGDKAIQDDTAPLAATRRAITMRHPRIVPSRGTR
jgi:hypothetical protein